MAEERKVKKHFLLVVLLAAMVALSASAGAQAPAAAAAPVVKTLAAPAVSGGMSLTEALAKRRSVRAFAATPVTDAELSQLLWAAQGITEPTKKMRAAPSAHNWYFLHVYVVAADGLWEYQPDGHKLLKVSGTDYRQTISMQPSVKSAPLSLLVVGEYGRAAQVAGEATVGRRFVDLEAGHATENLLLQATALNLGVVSVGGVDPVAVQKLVSLPADRTAIYLIPVGRAKQ